MERAPLIGRPTDAEAELTPKQQEALLQRPTAVTAEGDIYNLTCNGEIDDEQEQEIWLALLASLASAMAAVVPACAQQQQKPNILVIMADDIGYWNISA